MGAYYWIKLWHEVLHDPKMGLMPDNLWRRAIELFLLAGELDQEGYLPCTNEIAWRLRRDDQELEKELRELEKLRILRSEGDCWLVINFAKRQAKVEPKERMRQYRKRKRQEEIRVTPVPQKGDDHSHEVVTRTVTKRNTDIDIDKDTDNNKGTNVPLPKTAKEPGPKTLISNHFLEVTGLKMPRKKSDQKYHWSEIAELEHIGNKDPAIVNGWIDQIVPYMLEEGLSIHGPQSIKGFCNQLAAGQPLNGAKQNDRNGIATSKRDESRVHPAWR